MAPKKGQTTKAPVPISQPFADKYLSLSNMCRNHKEEQFIAFYELLQLATTQYEKDTANLMMRELTKDLAECTLRSRAATAFPTMEQSWTDSFRDRELTEIQNKEMYKHLIESRKRPAYRRLLGLPQTITNKCVL